MRFSRPIVNGYLVSAFVCCTAIWLGSASTPSVAWTETTLVAVGQQAARLTPPDLYRQLVKNHASYEIGLQEPFRSGHPIDRFADPDGQGRLEEAVRFAVQNAINAIQAPRPFNEISYHLGVVAHYVALLDYPLACSSADPAEPRYAADYAYYSDSALPRMQMVFYGFHPRVDEGTVDRVVSEALARCRGMYPIVGREYRRVGFKSGRSSFDDRSTAFAVTALGHSHAVSDIAEVLRYIWLRAGGADRRGRLPIRGRSWIPLSPLESASATAVRRSPRAARERVIAGH